MRSSSLVERAFHAHYICHALATAPSILVMFGLIFSSIAGVVSIRASLLGEVGLIGVALIATRRRGVRDYLDRKAEHQARASRESVRELEIRRASPLRRARYGELRTLVEESERLDLAEARRVDLEGLLDYFVRLTTNHERCLEALGTVTNVNEDLATANSELLRVGRTAEIQARRATHRDWCLSELGRIADEIGAVDELIRFVSQRIVCVDIDMFLGDEIDRVLAELDVRSSQRPPVGTGDLRLTYSA